MRKKKTEFEKAMWATPACGEVCDVKPEDMKHLIFCVEHPVDVYQCDGDDGFYTKREAAACKRWLRKWAPKSPYAR